MVPVSGFPGGAVVEWFTCTTKKSARFHRALCFVVSDTDHCFVAVAMLMLKEWVFHSADMAFTIGIGGFPAGEDLVFQSFLTLSERALFARQFVELEELLFHGIRRVPVHQGSQ